MWFHLNTLKFKWPRGRGCHCHVDSTAPGGCIWGVANSVSPPSMAGVGHGGGRVFQGVISRIGVRVQYGCIRPTHVCVSGTWLLKLSRILLDERRPIRPLALAFLWFTLCGVQHVLDT